MPPPDLLTLLGPAVCGLAAICVWWRYRPVTRGGVETDATVVRVAEGEHPQSADVVFRPVVEYRPAGGPAVTAECSGDHDYRTRRGAVRVGDRVRVRYHPARPGVAILAGRLRATYVTLAVVTALWVAVGLLVRAFPSP